MIRAIVVVIALAAYGACALLGSVQQPPAGDTAISAASGAQDGFSLSGAADLAATTTAKMSGLALTEMPAEGCSSSVLSPQQVVELLDRLQEPQRLALAKLLDVSSAVWTAQVYRGADGVGLCLPTQNRLLRLPMDVPELVGGPDDISDMVRSAAQAVRPQ